MSRKRRGGGSKSSLEAGKEIQRPRETRSTIECGFAVNELKYAQEAVPEDLAGWTDWREEVGKEAVSTFVRGVVMKEKERYKGLQWCLRKPREANLESADGGAE